MNLGGLAARDGLRTLLWDLDPQGAATYLLRVQPKVKGGARKLVQGKQRFAGSLRKGTDPEGLDLLPADFRYRNLDLDARRGPAPVRGLSRVLEPVAGAYDFVVLDCPPAISLASESVFGAADGAARTADPLAAVGAGVRSAARRSSPRR